jgi:hypothetical protein
MKTALTLNKMRFASCMRVTRLLQLFPDVTADNFIPLPVNKMNLTRCGIFRGKISSRKDQQNKTDLEERTQLAPNS